MKLEQFMKVVNDLVEVGRQVDELKRQLAEVTKERDQLRAMLNLADALRNRERNLK